MLSECTKSLSQCPKSAKTACDAAPENFRPDFRFRPDFAPLRGAPTLLFFAQFSSAYCNMDLLPLAK